MNTNTGELVTLQEYQSLSEFERRRYVEVDKATPAQVARGRVGRNEPCPCGSGKKFKHCHYRRGQ